MGKTKVKFTARRYRLLIGGVGATGITTKAEAALIGTFKEGNVLSIDTLPDGNNIILTVSKKFSFLQNAFNGLVGEPGSSVTYFFDIDGALIDCDTDFHEFYNVNNGLIVFYSPTITSLGNAMFDANFGFSPSNFIEYCFTPSVINLGKSSIDNTVFRSNSTNVNLYIDASLNGADADLTARTYNSITYATPTARIDTVGAITEGVNASGQIALTWSAPTAPGNIDAYFVFQDYSYIDSVTTEAITINKLTNDTTNVSIIAIDDQGNYSKMSSGQEFSFSITPMIMNIDTTNVLSSVSATDTIILPFVSGETVNLKIDWGDGGSLETYTDTNNAATHTYTTGGTYTVEIYNLNGPSVIPFNMNQTSTVRQDFSKFDEITQFGDCYLDNVTWGEGLFYDMIRLDITAPDLYSNVIQQNTNGLEMFGGCTSLLTTIDASTWDMSNYTSTANMFRSCSQIAWNFQNWNLTSCITTERMFSNLANVNIDTTGWTIDPTVLLNAKYMFYNCAQYNRDVAWLDPDGNDINFEYTFASSNISGAGISSWDGTAVTNYRGIFRSATNFNADVSNLISFTTPINVDVTEMFRDATGFLGQGLQNWNVSEITSLQMLFFGTNNMNTVTNLTGWDTSKVANWTRAFQNAWTGNLDFTWIDVTSATTMTRTWGFSSYTPDLTGLTFNTDCTFIQTFIGTGPEPVGLDTWGGTDFIQSTVGMFENKASTLMTQDLSSWNVSDIGNFANMFKNCTNFNPSAIFTMTNTLTTGLNSMFKDCTQFNLDISSWDFTQVTNMGEFGLNWGMDTTNYDLLLGALASQNLVLNRTTTMSSQYTKGELSFGSPSTILLNNLIDSSANFVTDGVTAGDILYNVTTDSYAEIISVTITTLVLDSDIFLALGQTYSVQGSQAAKDRYVITNTYNWNLTDDGPV